MYVTLLGFPQYRDIARIVNSSCALSMSRQGHQAPYLCQTHLIKIEPTGIWYSTSWCMLRVLRRDVGEPKAPNRPLHNLIVDLHTHHGERAHVMMIYLSTRSRCHD